MSENFKRGFVGAAGALTFAVLLALLLALLFPPVDDNTDAQGLSLGGCGCAG